MKIGLKLLRIYHHNMTTQCTIIVNRDGFLLRPEFILLIDKGRKFDHKEGELSDEKNANEFFSQVLNILIVN